MVEISFYLLSFIAISMLMLLFRSYPISKVVLWLFGGLTLWISYLILLNQTGILRDFGLPPKAPVFIVIPAILMIIFLVNRAFMRGVLQSTPVYLPVALQSFRIFVELLIYATFLKGIFPQRATFEGLNFDILVGISAIFVSLAVFKGLMQNRGVLIWNVLGLGVLTLTVYSFISTYYFSDFVASGKGYLFVEFPYLLLASVLLPVAIFLHVFSIKQVLQRASR